MFQRARSSGGGRPRSDTVLAVTLHALATASGLVVVLIGLFLVREAWPALEGLGLSRFSSDPSWHPAPRAADGSFLLVPMLAGTVLAAGGAVVLAAPLGLLSAIFSRFYAPAPVGRWHRRLIEVLAGVPSVVYGFWGLVVLVPWIRRIEPPGPSLLAAVVILAIMILPTVALTADAALAAVPRAYIEAAAGLGLGRWTTLRGVVLPAARGGIATGALLQTGRALGETMAVLMVCGNVPQLPSSLFDPVRTLTANIALEMGYAFGDHRAALFVTGLLLLILVLSLVVAAELVRE